ncbi:hypothetical protein L7F22_041631 [Adiantum nelumboides]|nr:hypothetical protein [Adiantum nelumboides]
MVEKEKDLKVKSIRSDRGGEFLSENFVRWCKSEGIRRQLTTPYTPSQNGVVERKNRTIMEMARAVLAHASLPRSYWAEACNTAVYIQNCSPTHALQDMTPFQAYYGRKPTVSHFRVFGCSAFVHIPKEKRRKLDFKSRKLLFLGYSAESDAYRLYDPDTRTTTVSRDVVFDESFITSAEGAAAQPIPILPPPSLPDPPASPVITPSTSHPVPPIQPPDVSSDHALSDSDSDLDVADATPEVDLAPPRREKRIPGWLYSTPKECQDHWDQSPTICRGELSEEACGTWGFCSDQFWSCYAAKILLDRCYAAGYSLFLCTGWFYTELPVPPPAGLPRRSGRLQKRGQVYESNEFVNFALMSQIQDTLVEPSSVQEALRHNCWKRAMHAELDAIERNKTWTLVPRPPKRKVVSTKWIFKTKYKADGSLDKHKARLVARGFSQRPGVDFDETYAPIAQIAGKYLSDNMAGYLSTIFDIGGVIGAILAGHLSDKYNVKALIAVFFMYCAVPSLYLFRSYGGRSLAHAAALMTALGIFVNGPYALITTAVSADLGTHNSRNGNARALATVSAIIDGTGSVGAAVGPFLTGYIATTSWTGVFIMLFVSLLIAGLFLFKLVLVEIKEKIHLCLGFTRIEQEQELTGMRMPNVTAEHDDVDMHASGSERSFDEKLGIPSVRTLGVRRLHAKNRALGSNAEPHRFRRSSDEEGDDDEDKADEGHEDPASTSGHQGNDDDDNDDADQPGTGPFEGAQLILLHLLHPILILQPPQALMIIHMVLELLEDNKILLH